MLVLLIEDDAGVAQNVKRGLQRAGFEVHWAADGDRGLELAVSANYDAALVDLMLPGTDGLTLIARMREAKVHTPVIVLSAKRSCEDKVTCLRSGADDYMSKPYDLPELVARIEAVLRRSQPAGAHEKIEEDGVVLDLLNRTARRDGRRVELTPREFALLELLMRNKGRPLSKPYLIERLWDYRSIPQTNLADVLVCRLRNNLDRYFPRKLIHTVRGIGYVFRSG